MCHYLDPTSDVHDQLREVTPFTSLSDPDPDLKASDSCPESRPESGDNTGPGSAAGDETLYISSGNADILEEELKGSAIGLRSDDGLHDVVADQVNIASDPDCESTPDIVGIADHQWNSGTLEVLCLYATGETEWHPFDLVQADDPTSLATYIHRADLGNSAQAQIIKRWSRVFKQALRRVFKHCVKSNCFKFYLSSYHPTPKVL